ncbi:hypothetical protein EC548_04395 [Helicobacter pylori]|nr:hypothetical protein EC548_04395 [Helicobacter pylori]
MPLCCLRLAIICNHKKVNSISLCRFLFLEVFIMGTCSMESILDAWFQTYYRARWNQPYHL